MFLVNSNIYPMGIEFRVVVSKNGNSKNIEEKGRGRNKKLH